MVAHQHVRVNRAAAPACGFAQAFEIKPAIDIAEEASRPIVAALDDVQWNICYLDPRRAGHMTMRFHFSMVISTHRSAKSYSDPIYLSRLISAVLSQRPWPAAAMRPKCC